jgi:hypothetical protein
LTRLSLRALLLASLMQPAMPSASFAALDGLESRLLQEIRPILRWERAAGGQGRLDAGEETIVRLGRGDMLRIRADGASLTPKDLSLSVSNGTGVLAFSEPLLSSDGQALVLEPPTDDPVIVRIARPREASGALKLAFDIGRLERPSNLVAYRDRLDLAAKDVQVSSLRQRAAVTYDPMSGGTPATVAVSGPARLEVRTRLLDQPAPGDWYRTYRIEATFDGKPWQVLEFEAAPDLADRNAVDGQPKVLGREQTGYLDIPAGDHSLTLDPTRPLLAQIMMKRGDDYLLPDLNAPPGLVQARQETGSQAASIWSLPSPRAADLTAALDDPGRLESLARRLARDNSRIGGGLTATALLRQTAQARPADPSVGQIAERFDGAYNFFRDVIPDNPDGVNQQAALVSEPTLLDPGEPLLPDEPPIVDDTVLLDRLIRGVFVPVPKLTSPLTYRLPAREAPSELRLLVDQGRLDGTVELLVQYNDAAPQRLRVLPERDLPAEAYAPGLGETGLRRLAERTGTPVEQAVISKVFPDRFEAAPLIEAGTVRLPLPVNIHRVRIWQDAPKQARSRVALQYRASRMPDLDEAGYAEEVRRLGREQALVLFGQAVKSALTCPNWLAEPVACPRPATPRSIAAEELHNDWLPLLRLLRARYRTLFGSIPANTLPTPSASPTLDTREAARLSAEAQRSARQGQWMNALENWSAVTRNAGGMAWQKAQLDRIEALRRLGESFLAERLLRALYLAPDTPDVRDAAFDRLAAFYREQESNDALLGLYAGDLVRGSNPARVRDLALALIADGQDEPALKLGLLLPPELRPRALAQVAYRIGWNRTFDPVDAAPVPATLRSWVSADALVTGHAGGVIATSLERALPQRLYRATPAQPVRLRVEGPARLRIQARPLHDRPDDPPIDGWLHIALGNTILPVAVSNNSPTPNLEIAGITQRAGTAVTETIDVPPGIQEIAVVPKAMVALVTAEIETGIPPAMAKEDVAHRLARLLFTLETEPARAAEVLARAARLAYDHAGDSRVTALWDRFERRSRWARLESVDSSAGIRTLPVAEFQPESPGLRARAALLPPLGPDERLLQGQAEIALSVYNLQPAVIEARLALAELPTIPAMPLTVRYRIDDAAPVRARLSADQPARTLSLSLPEGEHTVRFAIEDMRANQYVRLRLNEPGRESDDRLAGQKERVYHAATREEPITFSVQGPSWLRIDEYRDGSTLTRYHPVEAGWQRITIPPDDGRDQALLRIFRLEPDAPAPLSAGLPLARTEFPAERPPASAMVAWPATSVQTQLGMAQTLPGRMQTLPGTAETRPGMVTEREDRIGGTLSLGFSLERRLPTDIGEDEDDDEEPDEFLESRATFRTYNEALRLYSRTDLLGRLRFDEGPTMGLRQRFEHRPYASPLFFRGLGSFYGQRLDDQGFEWSATVAGSVGWQNDLSEKTSQTFELSAFARHLTLDGEEARGAEIDRDVFSPYKDDHPYGAEVAYRLAHRPWRDTRLAGELALTTNPEFNPFDPDHASLELNWRQLVGELVLEADYRLTRYFADDDRATAVNRNRFRLAALWENRTQAGDRYEIGGALGYRPDRPDLTGLLFLTWHFDRARGYRDFAPGEVQFEDIRSRRLFEGNDE